MIIETFLPPRPTYRWARPKAPFALELAFQGVIDSLLAAQDVYWRFSAGPCEKTLLVVTSSGSVIEARNLATPREWGRWVG